MCNPRKRPLTLFFKPHIGWAGDLEIWKWKKNVFTRSLVYLSPKRNRNDGRVSGDKYRLLFVFLFFSFRKIRNNSSFLVACFEKKKIQLENPTNAKCLEWMEQRGTYSNSSKLESSANARHQLVTPTVFVFFTKQKQKWWITLTGFADVLHKNLSSCCNMAAA